MDQIFAIANQKGGVAKTTTAVNLASSIAARGHRVLLVDFDPQANATSAVDFDLNLKPNLNVYRAILDPDRISDHIYSTNVPHLDLIPSTTDLVGFEIEALDLEQREYCLFNLLKNLRKLYDYIFIDCPPSLGLLTLNALTAADGVIVPLQAEYFALEGLGKLLETVELVSGGLNPSVQIRGIVLTMFDSRNNLSHQVEREIKNHFQNLLWRTKIPRNVRVSEAPSFGKPVISYEPKSPGALAYFELAKEFLAKFSTKTNETQPYSSTDNTSTERTTI